MLDDADFFKKTTQHKTECCPFLVGGYFVVWCSIYWYIEIHFLRLLSGTSGLERCIGDDVYFVAFPFIFIRLLMRGGSEMLGFSTAALVIDNGSGICAAGFSGDNALRAALPFMAAYNYIWTFNFEILLEAFADYIFEHF